MASPDVREDLARNLRIDFFEEDEIRSILSAIDRLPSDVQRTALALCHTLSQASSTFLPKAVQRIVKASLVFPHDRLVDWLDDIYRALDHEGVSAFVELSSLIDADDFASSFLSAGLPLDDVSPVLETYLKALSGREFPILAGPVSYTDLAKVYLPETLGDFPETDRNLFLYRYLCCQAWAQSVCGSLEFPPGLIAEEKGGEAADIDRYFSRFSDARLAADIFALIESQRITPFLERELPGLMRRVHEIRDHYLRRMSDNNGQDRNGFVRALLRIALGDAGSSLGRLGRAMRGIRGEGIDASVRLLEDAYAFAENLGGPYLPLPLPPVILAIRPEETGRQMRQRRLIRLRKYEGLVSGLLSIPEAPRLSLRLHAQRPGTRPVDPAKEYLVLKGRLIEFDGDLQEMMKDREGILGGILVKGADAPGAAGSLSLCDLAEEEEASAEPTDGGVRYDEWDFKRAGYKKAWCVVRRKAFMAARNRSSPRR